MTYRFEHVEDVFFVRFEEALTEPDVERFDSELGAKVPELKPEALVFIVDEKCHAPMGRARERISEVMGARFRQVARVAVVVEGEGVPGDARRTFVRALLLLAHHRAPIFSSLDMALRETLGKNAEQLARLREQLAARSFPM